MRILISLLMILPTFSKNARADEIARAPELISHDILYDFTNYVISFTRHPKLAARMIAKLEERVRTEKGLSTEHQIRRWRETLPERVKLLGRQMGSLLGETHSDAVTDDHADRAIGILADLAVALANASDDGAKLRGKVFGYSVITSFVGLGAIYALPHPIPKVALLIPILALGIYTSSVYLKIDPEAGTLPKTYEGRRDLALEMIELFWITAGQTWVANADEELRRSIAPANTVADGAADHFNFNEDTLVEGCERWLSK